MEPANNKVVDKPRISDMEDLGESLRGINTRACDHTIEKLRHLGTDYQGDVVIISSQCDCGRSVDEVFTISETKIY